MKQIASIRILAPNVVSIEPDPHGFDPEDLPPEGTPVYLLDPDLPDGVHRAPDGTLLAKGGRVTDGWERSLDFSRDIWTTEPVAGLLIDCWFEVRPIPKPATERVPLHELRGRNIEGVERRVWRVFQSADGGWRADTYNQGDAPHGYHEIDLSVDADGNVEVLVR